MFLIFTTLWANSADDKLMIFFSSPELKDHKMSLKYTNASLSVIVRHPFTLSKTSSQKSLDRLVRFYMKHLCFPGTKVYVIHPGHMTKMATMPMYGKNPLNILLQNHKSDDLETWHTAKGT